MTRRGLSHDERRVRDKLISGLSMLRTARQLRLAPQTVRDIANRLEYYGEIRRIPGTSNPISWEAVRPVTSQIPTESPSNGGGVTSEHPSVLLNGYPRGLADAHLHGLVRGKVVHVGTYDTIRDRAGAVVGDWSEKIATPRGRRDRFLTLYYAGQQIGVTYSEGNGGARTVQIYPGRVPATDETAEAAIMDRVNWIVESMRTTGWRISDTEIRGKIAYAYNEPGMMRHYQRGKQHMDAEVWVDTSKGEAELETTGSENAHIVEFLPTHIREIWDTNAQQTEQIATLTQEAADAQLSVATLNRDIAQLAREMATINKDLTQKMLFLTQRDNALLDILIRDTAGPAIPTDELRRRAELEGMYR